MLNLVIKYLHKYSENKQFPYKTLLNIRFTLHNISKLRAYLMGLCDKDLCDSTCLKLSNSWSCILG